MVVRPAVGFDASKQDCCGSACGAEKVWWFWLGLALIAVKALKK